MRFTSLVAGLRFGILYARQQCEPSYHYQYNKKATGHVPPHFWVFPEINGYPLSGSIIPPRPENQERWVSP